jgi:hypothetical protein
MRKLFSVLPFFCLSVGLAFGQQLATLNVTVTDPSGRLVQNASVTVTSAGTGTSRSHGTIGFNYASMKWTYSN